jgi:peptidoglycan/LPS O-acetylase OafA/YrhL
VADVHRQTTPGRWWKAFAIGAALWLAGTIALYVDDPSLISAASIGDALVSTFVLFGLLGYAFGRRFLARKVWKLAVPLTPIWDIAYPTLLLPERPLEASHTAACLVGLAFLVLALTKYIALFRYAYRSDNVWTERIGAACQI